MMFLGRGSEWRGIGLQREFHFEVADTTKGAVDQFLLLIGELNQSIHHDAELITAEVCCCPALTFQAQLGLQAECGNHPRGVIHGWHGIGSV